MSDRPSGRVDTLYSLGLFWITVLSRLPFRSRILYHWDSVNFANAMAHFDLLQEHPQPPGYIVYVWVCRVVDLLLRDANATMVWTSIVASASAVVVVYQLGRTMWNRRVGLLAALFLVSSPLFWFYGEIALPHTLDTLFVLLCVWLLFRIRQGENCILWPMVFLLAIAGGVRQQTLIFLLLLTLYAIWRVDWKRILLAALLGAAVCLVWFVPLMANCGGISAYLEKMRAFAERFQGNTSILMGAGWAGIAHNLRKLGMYAVYAMGSALLPLGVYGIVRAVRRRWPRRWDRLAFLGIWVAPALIFYGLIHMGQQGLVFVFLPALLLLGAVATDELIRNWRLGRWAAVISLALVNVLVFCLAPEYPLGPGTQRILTRDALVNSDNYYQERLAAIRELFPPESTAVIALEWAQPEYYLPEYTLLRLDKVVSNGKSRLAFRRWPGRAGALAAADLGAHLDPDGEMALLLFDAELETLAEASQLRKIVLSSTGELVYLRLGLGKALLYGPDALTIGENGTDSWRTAL